MIIGEYRDGAPRVTLTITARDEADIEFVLDTAFNGGLSLPADMVRRLGARETGADIRMLADGSLIRCQIFEITVDWDGERQVVELLSLATRPLLGTLLLDGSQITIEASDGGEVSIEPGR